MLARSQKQYVNVHLKPLMNGKNTILPKFVANSILQILEENSMWKLQK